MSDLSQELNIDASALKEVNVAVRQVLLEDKDRKKRGPYKSLALTPLQRCEIGKYASEVGIADACKKFHIPRTTTWHLKNTYEKEKENAKGSPLVSLNRRKRGRPMVLGAFIDDQVCQYVKALRDAGGVVNGKIVRAVANALLLFYNPSIGKESGEHVAVTKAVSRSIFRKLGYT